MHETGSLLAQGHTTTKAKGQDLILDLLLYSPISFLILHFLPDGMLVSEHPLFCTVLCFFITITAAALLSK